MITARIAGALSAPDCLLRSEWGGYMAIVCLYMTATVLTLCVVAPRKPGAAGAAASAALQPRRCAN